MEYGLHKLIRTRRELKGIARTKFAHLVGISPSSMVKYELPENEGGKIPSSINLLKICELLEIDPRDAFDAINSGIKHQEYTEKSHQENEPDWSQKSFSFASHFKSNEEWINDATQFKSIEDFNNSAENFFAEFHYIRERLERIEMIMQGKDPAEEVHKKWEQRHVRMADCLNKENGPDQKDPSRSMKSTINSKAVGAASIEPKKGKSDDVA